MLFADQRALGADLQEKTEESGVRLEPLLGSPTQTFHDQAPIMGFSVFLPFQGFPQGIPRIGRLSHREESIGVSPTEGFPRRPQKVQSGCMQ